MASRAERIEDAAGALLAASSRIEAETMCVVPRRLVDALRAALALPADAPAQPAPEGAGEAVALCDAPVGIFRTIDGQYGFKTEYHRQDGSVEAYCLDSGEAWWGRPPQTAASQRAQLVVPVAFPPPTPRAQAVAWASVQALIDSADKCADMMDAQECPVSSGGEEWDAALCELRERADAVRAARIDAWRPTTRAEAASAEAVRDLPPLKADEAVFQAANAVVARLIMSAGHRLTRYESELLRRLDSAIRSLPLPAAPASAEAVAREAASECASLADDMVAGRPGAPITRGECIDRAVAHALRAKGDR